LKSRDVKAVRKTVAGLVKLIHPHGEVAKEDLRELVELAMEGRRRVKEQLKKLGSFEFFQTSFSYIDKETGEERYVGVPEEGGRNVVSSDPLEPGSVYAASVDDQGKVGLCRVEIGSANGTGKLKLAGGIEGTMRESIQRAFGYLQGNKVKLGIAREFDTTDFHVEAIDLLQNRVACECGVALIVAVISAIKRVSVQPALVILGDISIQGNIKGVRTLVEPCQLAMENGARRALIPIENRRQFLEVSGDVAEKLDPIFYGDAPVAANKALAVT
jgi:ATP-dependent Lon protease